MIEISFRQDLGTVGKLATRATIFIYRLYSEFHVDAEKNLNLSHSHEFFRPIFEKIADFDPVSKFFGPDDYWETSSS